MLDLHPVAPASLSWIRLCYSWFHSSTARWRRGFRCRAAVTVNIDINAVAIGQNGYHVWESPNLWLEVLDSGPETPK
jgi:hypothetical protein